MSRIYGHRWTSGFGEADDGTWLTGLRDLLPEELAAGLRACIKREDDWPPPLPEFRRLCLGYMDKARAVDLALSGSNDAIPAMMRQFIGSWDMRHKNEQELRKQLASFYEDAVIELTTDRLGMPLEERKALSHDDQVPV